MTASAATNLDKLHQIAGAIQDLSEAYFREGRRNLMKGYQDINGIMGDTEPSPVSATYPYGVNLVKTVKMGEFVKISGMELLLLCRKLV